MVMVGNYFRLFVKIFKKLFAIGCDESFQTYIHGENNFISNPMHAVTMSTTKKFLIEIKFF